MRCSNPYLPLSRRRLFESGVGQLSESPVRCRSRLGDRCAGCSELAAGDWREVIRDGLLKPGEIWFVTLTAPSFGKAPIYKSKFGGFAEQSGWNAEEYAYEYQIQWQWDFSKLWHRTTQRFRDFAAAEKITRPEWIRIAEPHLSRSVAHQHALLRFEQPSPESTQVCLDGLWKAGWGEMTSAKKVEGSNFNASYLSKYLTKSTMTKPEGLSAGAADALNQHHRHLRSAARRHLVLHVHSMKPRTQRLYIERMGQRHLAVSKSAGWSSLTIGDLDERRRAWSADASKIPVSVVALD